MWGIIKILKPTIITRNNIRLHMDRINRIHRTTTTIGLMMMNLAREQIKRNNIIQTSREEVTEQMGHKNTIEMEIKTRIRPITIKISNKRTLPIKNKEELLKKSKRTWEDKIQIRLLQYRISRSLFLRVTEKTM